MTLDPAGLIGTPFKVALTRERVRFKYSRAQVAKHCGVGTGKILEWENGEAIPTPQQFKRLAGMMKRLRGSMPEWDSKLDQQHARDVLDSTCRVSTDISYSKDIDTGMPWPQEPPPAESFGTALRRIREQNGTTTEQLGQVLGVTGAAVRAWEHDNNLPVRENYDKLLHVLPELRIAIRDGGILINPQDIPKPIGPTGHTFPGQWVTPPVAESKTIPAVEPFVPTEEDFDRVTKQLTAGPENPWTPVNPPTLVPGWTQAALDYGLALQKQIQIEAELAPLEQRVRELRAQHAEAESNVKICHEILLDEASKK